MFKVVYFVSRSQFASHNHAKRTGHGRKNFSLNAGASFAPESNASGIATNSIVESDGATSPLKNFVATVNSMATPSTLDSLNNNTDNQDVVRQKRLPGGISFLLGLLFSIFCSVADLQAQAFINLDSTSSGQVSQNSATSWTWSHTNGSGTNRLLLVGCAINNSASEDVLAVTNTFNGVSTALTKIGSVSNGPNVLISYFYLRNAPAGSNLLTAYNSGNGGQAIGGSASYIGVNPNATFSLQYATGSTMVASLTMTNIAQNEVIFDIIGQRPTNTILAAESSATLRWIRNTTFGAAAKNVRAASSTKEKLTPGVGDLTINWTNSGGAGTNWVLAAVAVGAPPAPTITTISDHTIVEDGATTNISFVISTNAGGPPLLFGSTNQTLIPNANIQITQVNSSNFTVKATPVANQFGTTLISITNADYGAVVPRYAVSSFLVNVLPVDDQPTLNTIGNQTVLEDAGNQNVSLGGISAGSPANESGQTLTITATSSDPAIVPNPSISYTQGNSTGTLTYTPAANASGTATITVTAQDNGGTSNGGIDSIVRTFNITVTSVNDVPTLDAVSNRTINEDSAQTINLTGISAGPASESSQTIVVSATSSNPSVIPDPSVTYTSPSATGTLQFTPVANASGSATITVTVQDNGGTANGGVHLLTRTFNVSVTAVNDAPTLTALSNVTINEDASMQTINLSGIGSGASDEGLQVITVTATSSDTALIPNPGVLYIWPGNSGSLMYTPVANAFGVATITVIATDTGGIANGGVNAKTNTFTVTVNGVNDVPSFTKGGNQTVLEDAAPQTVANWATAISAGPANESAQVLTCNVSNNNNSLFSVQPAVSSSGTLTYTAAANANGAATVTISLSDDGETANSGIDTSAAQTFTISVTAVNDAPTLAAIANLAINEDAGLQTVNLSGISSGAPNESQTLVVTATSSNTSLIPHPSVTYISPNVAGTLSFSPVANVHGSATVSVVLTDGVQSITNTFLVTVTSVEDAPTLAVIGNLTINEDATTQTVNLSGISSGAANEVQTLTVTAVSSNPTLVPHPMVSYTSAQSTGALTFSPSANEYGSATVSVVVNDGVLAVTNIFTVTVNAVEDSPALNAISNVTVNEDSATQVIALSGISSGAANENQNLAVTAESSNPTLISNPVVSYTSPNAGGTLSFTPSANESGSTVISVVLNDGVLSVTNTFTVTVQSVEDAPTLAAIGNVTVRQGDGARTVNLSGISSGAGNENQVLVVTATSSDLAIVPHPVVTYVSPGASGSLVFTPVPETEGTAVISVVVSDGVLSVTNTFVVTVTNVDEPPTLDSIAEITINEDSGLQTLSLTGISCGAANENQTVTIVAVSDTPALIPNPVVNYTNPLTTGVLEFSPAANQNGSAIISLIISDDSQSVTQQFTVVVSPVNDAPIVNAVDTQYLLASSSRNVSITGIGTGAVNENQTLSVNATSSNPLISASVNYTSPGATAQVTLTVGEIVFEEATIVVAVSDGGLTTSRNFHVSAGKKKASFAAVQMTSPAGPISLWLANLRGKDTWRDLIVANYIAGSITYRLCDDLGGFTLPKTIVLGGNPSSVFAADVNGDKFQDIMVGDYAANTIVLLRNLKTGTFGPAERFRVGTTPLPGVISVRVSDMNSDGRGDIITANQLENSVSVLFNTGGTFSGLKTVNIGGSPICAWAEDMTGDGKLDLHATTSDAIYIIPGDGRGNFDTADIRVITPFPGGNPNIKHMLTADLNGDGRADFATANANSNSVSVFLAQPTGGFILASNYSVGTYPQHLLIRDVNHDGIKDITVANTGSDNLSILIGGANGVFVRQIDVPAGDGPVAVVGSNLNEDYGTDLVVANYAPGVITVLIFDAPLSYPVTTTAVEDTAKVVTLNGKIVNKGSLQYRITRAPVNGTLNVSGTFTDPKVVYTPAANYFGSDNFAYISVTDSMESVSSEVTIAILPANDRPTFALSGHTVALEKFGVLNSFSNMVSSSSVGPANESNQKISYIVTTTNGSWFAVKPALSTNGTFSFKASTAASGSTYVTIQAKDTGGIINGGIDLSTPRQVCITIPANPYAPVKGNYYGLFHNSTEVTHESSGYVQMTTDSLGAFSGKVMMMGKSFGFSGRFNADGFAAVSVSRGTNGPALGLQLNIGTASGLADQITGTVTDGTWSATVEADRAIYSFGNPVPQMGSYTMIIPGNVDPAAGPSGDSYATVTVGVAGNIRMIGSMADGKAIAQTTMISKNGQWPLYNSLYAGKGSIVSWITFTNDADTRFSGAVSWIKTPAAGGTLYGAGFTNVSVATGSLFTPAAAGQRIVGLTTAVVQLDGGNLLAPLTTAISISTLNKVTVVGANPTKMVVTIMANGAVSGSFQHPVSGMITRFAGVAFQDQDRVGGYFPGSSEGGHLQINAAQ